MIIPLAHIRLTTHHAYISMSDSAIHILKYNDRGCDYGVFDQDESLMAGDYILEPLPTHQYTVEFEGEFDDWAPTILLPKSNSDRR